MKFLPCASFLKLAMPRIMSIRGLITAVLPILLLFIFIQASFGQCSSCNNNLITNPGFNTNVLSWNSYNGDFYRNTAFPQCGTSGHAEMKRTSGWAAFFQDLSNIPEGNVLNLTFWAGVHDPAFNAVFGLEFYNGNTYLSETTAQIDKVLGGSPSMQFYTVIGVVPANCNKVRVVGKMDNGHLKADEICLQITATSCNPDNSNAPPFCAPEPVCTSGNFLWNQSIDPSNGAMSTVRLVCGNTVTYVIPGPYPIAMSSASTVNISDVVSYDGYVGRNVVTQSNEKWRVVFKKNGSVVASSPYTNDVPDQVNQGYWKGSLGSLILPNGADEVLIEHWSVGNGNNCNNGPNSVVPASICFSVTPLNQCRDFTSLINTDLNLVKTRTVINQQSCNSDPDRVLYINCLLNHAPNGGGGNAALWKIISGGEFKEYCDGTAFTEFRVQNIVYPTYKFDVSIILTGRTYTAPTNSPKLEGCTSAANTDWYYYTGFKGSFIGVEGMAGANLSFLPMGPALQLGTNAALYGTLGNFGASEWLTYKIISQPTAFNLVEGCQSDFNLFLTGGALTQAQSTKCESVCSGSQVTLNGYAAGGKPGYTYAWSNNLGSGTTKTLNIIGSGAVTYTITVTDNLGCSSTDNVIINVNPNPSVDAGADATLCNGQSIVLTANGSGGTSPYTYAWSNGVTSKNQTVTPTATKTYTVSVTDSKGCAATDNVTITIAGSINLVATNTAFCTGGSGTISASATNGTSPYTYNWSNGLGGGASKTVTVAGNYTVTVTDDNGCTKTAVSVVTISNPPTASAGADITTTCTNPTATLTATGGGSYVWNTGASTASITVNPTAASTNYTVTVTSANGCTATDVVAVIVNKTLPSASAGADITTTCTNPTATLTATGGGSYVWNTGASTASITVNPTAASTNYTVTVTSANGCSATDVVAVIVNKTLPSASAGADVTTTCTNPTATITATGGGSYVWNTGASTASITVNPTAASTNYTVTVISANGCTASDVVAVIVNKTLPTASAGADITTTCTNPTATLTATGGGSYVWNTGASTASITVNPTAASTNYTVTVTSANGCTASDVVAVIVNKAPPTANAGGNKIICNGTNATLTATGNGTYLWSNNSTTASITVSPAATTTYTVTVTNVAGCTASSQAVVTVTSLPVSGLTGPDQICVDEFGLFSANPPLTGATYAWTFDGGVSQDGDANDATEAIKWPNALQNTSRTVTLTVSKDGCSSVFTKTVYVKTGVYLNTANNYPVCQGGSVQIGPNSNDPNAVSPGATFQWTPNLFLNSNTVAQPISSPPFDITYTLTAALNGCAVSKQIVVDVNVNLNPIANAGPDKTICIAENVKIGGNPTATPPAGGAIAGVIWTPSNSTLSNPMVSPTSNQTYRVVVVATSGCADTDYVNIVVLPKGKIGDYVWSDTGDGSNTANGCQDADEVGINGVTVKLFAVGGGEVASTTTINNPISGKSGYYQFEVCGGEYYVNFGKPSGYVFTDTNTPSCGSDYDSDANKTTGNSPIITLVSGQTVTNIDAGLYQAAKLGDYVWEDLNFNGLQDTGEPSIANVVVMLEDANGNVAKDINGVNIASTVTNAQGKYEFVNLKPGVGYVVKFTKPSGFEPTGKDKGSDTKDSDADLTTGKSQIITLSSGENNTTIDAGYYKLASLGDFVWEDKNGNGIQDIGEPGVGGLTVTLTGTKGDGTIVNLSTSTNTTTGLYSFTSLMPGTYTVTFTKPNGDVFTSQDQGGDNAKDSNANPITGASSPVTIVSGENNMTIDAGILRTAKLGDYVWEDLNLNGLQDIYEPGIANVVVRLFNSDGIQIAFKATDANGGYQFTNLSPGPYRVKFDKPIGYQPTGRNKGDDTKDSDADLVSGMTDVIIIQSGDDNKTIDAGFFRFANIGDFVWEDRNANGIQNETEIGIPNVTVNLTGIDVLGENVSKSTTTSATGYYKFTNLIPGTYTLTFINPGELYKPSPMNAVGDAAKDSNASPVDGKTSPVVLVSGETNNTIDAGFYKCAQVGDYVWLDQGLVADKQDAGDVGLNGIVVELYSVTNPSMPIQTTLTSNNPNNPGKKGYYNFEVCGIGEFFIKVLKTAAYDYVQPNQGLDDGIDSDIIDFENQKTLNFAVNYAQIITDIDAGLKLKPLPVVITEFTAFWNKSKDINILNWRTATEKNNDRFEIERSINGGSYRTIGVVKGSGNSAELIDYSYDDRDNRRNGKYTYRLKQIDFDGKYAYSELREVVVERIESLTTSIYPNPMTDRVNIELTAPEGSMVTASIYDNTGKLVRNNIINQVMIDSYLFTTITNENLIKGVYSIVLIIDGKVTVHKLIVVE